MGVEKQYDSDEQYLADSTMPSVIGYTEDAAAEALTGANLTYRTVGSGDTVTAQVPASGSVLANSSEVVLYMGENASTETVVMPDLTGMGKSAARQTLEDLGLYYKASGLTNNTSAAADGQSVTAGTEVVKGTVITVHFSKQETEIIQ
jgi:stage V sporulation protein D (sporulation-specific penicillin-binding protein)